MTRFARTRVVVLGLALLGGGVALGPAPAAQQEVAAVESLKTEAYRALRGGQFDPPTSF